MSDFSKPQLILMVGVSGSGKSTHAEKLRTETPRGVVLSSDRLRAILGQGEHDQTVSGPAFASLRTMVEYFLKYNVDNAPVIVDATNLNKKSRKDFIQIGRKYNAFISAICVNVELTEAKGRNKTRSRVVPEHVIDSQFERLDWPTTEEVDEVKYV